MENREIINILRLTASLMELHEENPFKIKSFQSAIFNLEKINEDFGNLPLEKLIAIEGIGKSFAAKIHEINTNKGLEELIQYLEKTPKGVIAMLNIKGIGPKKVRTIWKELNIESKESLLKACNENKISELKGFGEKTQEAIKQELIFEEAHKGKFMYAALEELAETIENDLKKIGIAKNVSLSGDMRRKMEVIETIQFLIGTSEPMKFMTYLDKLPSLKKDSKKSGPMVWRGNDAFFGVKIEIKFYTEEKFIPQLFIHSSAKNHLLAEAINGKSFQEFAAAEKFSSEEEIYQKAGLPYIEPELREGITEIQQAREGKHPILLRNEDLKGILHNHTTYSDGAHTLKEMAEYCKKLGYEYLGISDHSKTAFYANGLYENRVQQQHKEIDELNKTLAPFKIFKGIESDILNDGALDYEKDTLQSFDFIVASIHSNLKMNEEKATARLLKAIENPYTTILGHATGRLLLKREGYPINYRKIIDACAANKVIIEINANPRRLDMDWRWVIYAIQKGIMISINPDAHSMAEYHNMKFGVYMGRKAGLTKEMTFNALPLAEMENYFKRKKL